MVITLVAVIVGILGKKKKPATSGSGEKGRTRVGGFFENLEKAFQMGQEEQVVLEFDESEEDMSPEESDYEPGVADDRSPQTSSLLDEWERYMDKPRSVDSGISLSASDLTTDPLEVIDLDDQEGTDYFEVVEDFNAATAVVYAAIINRIDY